MTIDAERTVRKEPSFERTTALVARALRLSADTLLQSFARVGDADLSAVLALRAQAFEDPITWDDPAYLRWRYGLGTSRCNGRTLWLLRRGDRILGIVGTEVLEIATDDGVVEAIKIMDLAVDPRFAIHGIGGWMVMNLCRLHPVVLAIGHNANSRLLAQRLFQRLPDRRAWSLPLDPRRLVRSKIRSAPFAAVVGTAAKGFAAAASAWLLRPVLGIELRRVDHFGRDIDVLLANVRRPGEVWIAKSVNSLNWRLLENPRGRCTVWAASVDGTVVGYMATIVRVRADGIRNLEIVDWGVEAGRERLVFRALCRQALADAREAEVEAIVTTAYHAPSERLLRSFGFVPRRREVEFIGLAGNDSRAVQRLAANPNWHLTSASNDRD